MIKAYKYRIYPTRQQALKIDATISICRFVYNLALETKIYAYRSHGKNFSSIDLCHQLVELKKDHSWLSDCDSQALQSSIRNMDSAFCNFFNGSGFPKFKSKSSTGSFQCPNNTRRIDWNNHTLTIPKIKDIPIILSRKFDGTIKTITISRTSTSKYYASILVESADTAHTVNKIISNTSVGIDLGIKSFAVTSDGRSFEPNRFLKESLGRLQCLSKMAAKKKKGSNNRKKANRSLAILYEKIANQRTDFLHKITTGFMRDSQAETFVIENLNVAGMIKNRSLSQAISDVSWGEFRRQMEYKCRWYGKNLVIIGRFEPTSKMCSACGEVNQELTLADREWRCRCGVVHDRDINAAVNIKNSGLKKYSGVGNPGEPVESRRNRRTKKQEGFGQRQIPYALQLDNSIKL